MDLTTWESVRALGLGVGIALLSCAGGLVGWWLERQAKAWRQRRRERAEWRERMKSLTMPGSVPTPPTDAEENLRRRLRAIFRKG